MINSSTDFSFYIILLVPIFALFSSYFIVYVLKKIFGNVSFTLLSELILFAVLLQNLLALSLFFNPDLFSSINALLVTDELNKEVIEKVDGIRLVGVGIAFFQAGAINSVALLILGTLYGKEKSLFSDKGLAFSFWLLVIIGSMMARTTLVGAFFALLLLFFRRFVLHEKIRLNYYFYFFIFFVCILFVVYTLGALYFEFLPKLLDYSFELFINYFESNNLSTASTEDLVSNLVFPSSCKTWIIGDGLFVDPLNSMFHYMGVDTGFLRICFLFGLLGVIIYMIYNVLFLYACYKRNQSHKYFFVFVFLLLITLLTKELFDIMYIFSLYLYLPVEEKKIIV